VRYPFATRRSFLCLLPFVWLALFAVGCVPPQPPSLRFQAGGIPFTVRYVPAGTFTMGSAVEEFGREEDETPHPVSIASPFYLGETEITQDLFAAVMGENPSFDRGMGRPVEQVGWRTAIEFTRRLSRIAGAVFTLPTESEWEYACRAGSTGAFGALGSSSSCRTDFLDPRSPGHFGSGKTGPASVGSYPPNAWGFSDLHGNVAEWCLDSYGDYETGPVIDPPCLGAGFVVRGGSWSDPARKCRSAARAVEPGAPSPRIGFRIVYRPPMGILDRLSMGLWGSRYGKGSPSKLRDDIPHAFPEGPRWRKMAPETSSARSLPGPYLRRGDRLALIGDSITHLGLYHEILTRFFLTRYPASGLTVRNAGMGGNTAQTVLDRLDWDVISNHPTVASVMIGMNDLGNDYADLLDPSGASGRAKAGKYGAEVSQIVDGLGRAGIRVLLLSPSIYDQSAALSGSLQPRANEALARLAGVCGDLARTAGVPYVDLFTPLTALNARVQASNRAFSIVSADRVHPGRLGSVAIAYYLLKALRADDRVGSVDISVRAPERSRMAFCRIRPRSWGSNWLSFDRLSESLPFPLLGEEASIDELVPWTEEFNQDILRVRDLPPGRYLLKVDGRPILDASSEHWALGINLASQGGMPEALQAVRVARWNRQRHDLESQRLRLIDVVEYGYAPEFRRRGPLAFNRIQPALEKMRRDLGGQVDHASLRQIEAYLKYKPQESRFRKWHRELEERARFESQPVWHCFQIVPMGG